MLSPFALAMFLAIPNGIPRELAQERASEISDVRYRLHFELALHATTAPGNEEIRFRLSKIRPLLLDFRGESASNIMVNGPTLPVEIENGHILIPTSVLEGGENAISLEFVAAIAAAGKTITRYEDKEDGSEYIYSLSVPMDASMAFPCFDQPDLKARFTLSIGYPTEWTVISNAPAWMIESAGMISKVGFEETKPISTYLFAFAAGRFQAVHPVDGLPNVYVRASQLKRAETEIPQVQQVTANGIKFLSTYFAQPFPFPKYDMVLIPGFPFGGMEHAGATFLNEDSVLFRSAPTDDDRFNRSTLLLHELTHQWFGDLTTMRWFDDLWLKEGFATYMAYRTLDALAPDQNVWAHFYQQIKPAAYGIDETQGTTPIYQDISNLKDAKSAYGAIVYSKAPGLLRQLAYKLGEEQFRNGLRIYLKEHLYANAQWSDLVGALDRSSGQSLKSWAEAWIHRRGMPEIHSEWSCENNKLAGLTLSQRNAIGEGGLWPIATQVLLGYSDAPAYQTPCLIRWRIIHPRRGNRQTLPRLRLRE